jgi:uncharacterized protein (TIRG00374 family)
MPPDGGRRLLGRTPAPPRDGERPPPQREPVPADFADQEELATAEMDQGMRMDSRRIAIYLIVVAAIVVALYFVLPKITGLEDALATAEDADPVWIAVALALNVLSFFAYIALLRGIVGGRGSDQVRRRLDVRASYQITLAGLAATRLFSAGGAGGIALTYWALRRAGMGKRETASRMVAFLVVLYTIYLLSVVVCGIFLRVGLFPGASPVGMTIVPAAIAGVVLVGLLLVSLIPDNFETVIARWAEGHRRVGIARRFASIPATVAGGTREALSVLRHPGQGMLSIVGAAGFWAANIAVLWACFHAFGVSVPKAVLVQGFFVGMAANLLPFFPGGVGSVDAGMIAAFLAFGVDSDVVFPAVLLYRVIAFWLPIPPGALAYLQLRKTVARWKEEDESEAGSQSARPSGGDKLLGTA